MNREHGLPPGTQQLGRAGQGRDSGVGLQWQDGETLGAVRALEMEDRVPGGGCFRVRLKEACEQRREWFRVEVIVCFQRGWGTLGLNPSRNLQNMVAMGSGEQEG